MWKNSFSNPSTSEPVYRGHQGPMRELMRREMISAAKELIKCSKYGEMSEGNESC